MAGESILVIAEQDQTAQKLCHNLQEYGHSAIFIYNAGSGLQWFMEYRPALVFVHANIAGAGELIDHMREICADFIIVVLSAAEQMPRTMSCFKQVAEEFLSLPADAVTLDIMLRRALRTVDLLRQAGNTCRRDRDARSCSNLDREVAVERFLAVRQIIEKMSAFIAQVSTGVQGGVKYFNELPYFVAVHSAACQVLATNPTSIKYLGNRLYQNSWEIFAGKRGTPRSCPVCRTVRSGTVKTTRALVRYKSGAKVPVLVHTAPIYDNNGEVVLILEVFAGTQEIEQLAQQILSTQQRYEQLFDAVPLQLIVLDRHFNITATNQKFKAAFGDQIGSKFFEIFRPGTFPAYRDPISLTLRDGQAHQGEMVLTGPDHRQYTMMARTTPIVTGTGKLVQVLVIFSDITEFRLIKDNIASLGLMLSTVCHDMKGCLTGLDAGLYLIDKGFYRDRSGQIEEGLEVARMMSDRIRRLILDVLYSTKERPLELLTIDVLRFAADISAAVENRIRGADVAFRCDFSLCAGEFQIDTGLVRSAMINILDNALEACLEDDRKAEHRIDMIVRSEQTEVIFEIKDNGGGMSAEETKQIFNIFYSSKGRKGTGLGLYITHKVIKKHGGRIEVGSGAGKGTEFKIYLPRLPRDEAKPTNNETLLRGG